MNELITLLFHDIYARSPEESGFAGAAADRYKMSTVRFRAHLASIERVRADAPVLLTTMPKRLDTAPPFALSVDDGGLSYHSIFAPCLADRGWVGHCLITTGQIGKPGFLHKHHIRELHEAGHLIGSHSVTHPPRFNTCSWEQLVREWSQSRAALEDIIGAPVKLGSIPGGAYSREVVLAAREAGLTSMMTSEPETRRQLVDGCEVFGRFTLRANSPQNLSGRLVRQGESAQRQQWLAWNAKKLLKKSLGTGYLHLTGLMARR